MIDEDELTGIRVSVFVSGLLSCVGSFCLFILLIGWFRTLLAIREAGTNVTVRSTLCRFMIQLSICDFFTACAYICSFFVQTFEVDWFCITEATLMVIFEYASLLWTGCIAYLLWRVSILCAPQERWAKEDFERAVMVLKLTEVFCTVLCWFGPLAFVVLLGATDLLGHKDDGSWCWITDRSDRGWWIQLLCFYTPLWLIVRTPLPSWREEEVRTRG